MSVPAINLSGVWAIYRSEMQRTQRTILQSVATPVTDALGYTLIALAYRTQGRRYIHKIADMRTVRSARS